MHARVWKLACVRERVYLSRGGVAGAFCITSATVITRKCLVCVNTRNTHQLPCRKWFHFISFHFIFF